MPPSVRKTATVESGSLQAPRSVECKTMVEPHSTANRQHVTYAACVCVCTTDAMYWRNGIFIFATGHIPNMRWCSEVGRIMRPSGGSLTDTYIDWLAGMADTGQGLANTAVAGLAKALGRNRKRAEKRVAGRTTGALEAQPNGAANKAVRLGKGKAIASGDGANGPPTPGLCSALLCSALLCSALLCSALHVLAAECQIILVCTFSSGSHGPPWFHPPI